MTNLEDAARAKKFGKWLTHKYFEEYSSDNLSPYNLHALLDNKNGYLKNEYVADPYDGHPKKITGPVVGKMLRKHLDKFFE